MMRQGLWRWGLVGVLLLAAALRWERITAQSLWNDEGNSARLSERSLELIIAGTASDIHPPLYYLLLRGWRELVGDSEFGLRSLSALSDLLTVALAAATGRWLWPRRRAVALLAAALLALNPALVYYAQEARMYALLALLVWLSSWLLLQWWSRTSRGRPAAGWALGYVLAVTAGLYTHYFFPVAPALQGAWLLGSLLMRRPVQPWRVAGRWLGLVGVALAAYAPWLPIFLRQAGGRGAEGSAAAFVRSAARFLLFGDTVSGVPWFVAGCAVVLLLLAGAAPWRGRRDLPAAALLLGGLLLPLGGMATLGATAPQFHKFLLLATVPVALLLALGTLALCERRAAAPLRLLPFLLLLPVIWWSGQSLRNLYFDPAYARADYRGMAARIAAEAYPNAGIILDAPNQWEVFTYYHREGAPVYPLPLGGNDAASIAAALAPIAARHDRLYALFWGEAEQDPQRLVERWLDANAFKATDEWVGDVRYVTYGVAPTLPDEPVSLLGVRFDESMTLLGFSSGEPVLQAGEVLAVALFWRADVAVGRRWKVFLHLVDDTGRLVAQRDSEPGGGLALTTTWVPGAVVNDKHGILVPSAAPPGRYTLRVGLYDLGDPTLRAPITLADGQVTDAISLLTVVVAP